jgi:hypothetical protein
MSNEIIEFEKTDLASLGLIPSGMDLSIEECRALQVVNAQSYDAGAKARLKIKTFLKDIEARRKAATEPYRERINAINNLVKGFCEVWEQAEKGIGSKLLAWDEEQRRKQLEEQRRINAALAKKADEEKAALEAKALAALQRGKEAAAVKLVEKMEAVKAQEVVFQPVKPTSEGVSYRETWKAEVNNVDLVPRGFLMVDEQKLNKFARETKGSVVVPGVRFYPEKTLIQR